MSDLPSWWHRVPTWLSVLVNDLAAPLLISGLAMHDLLYNAAGPVSWVLALATIWPLVLRRRAPVVTFFVELAALAGLTATASPPFAGFALLPALYTVAAHRTLRTAILSGVALELFVVLVAVQQAPARSIDDTILILSAAAAASLLLGTTLRTQRRYLASVEDRALRLERERAREAELAARAERAKIAREMHDIVAHGLSVVVTLAEGAATRAEQDPRTARAAMEQVAAAGRQSMGEMRRLLGVLRSDETPARTPQPDMGDLDALLDDVRATGLVVDLEPAGDLASLEPTLQATLYRSVQEGLTNVIKHARDASRVTVRIAHAGDDVVYTVHDDGRRVSATEAGNGLAGMAERAAIFDGSVTTWSDASGWTVHGVLKAVTARSRCRSRTSSQARTSRVCRWRRCFGASCTRPHSGSSCDTGCSSRCTGRSVIGSASELSSTRAPG